MATGCDFGVYEQPYKISFQLRSETEAQTDANEMTLPNGG